MAFTTHSSPWFLYDFPTIDNGRVDHLLVIANLQFRPGKKESNSALKRDWKNYEGSGLLSTLTPSITSLMSSDLSAFVWQISCPPANGASQGNYFLLKSWHHVRVYVDFFFQLNLLPPYSLCLQGDKCNDENLSSN